MQKNISETVRPRVFPSGNILPFVLVTILFFIWGMSNNLTDILVQQFKKSFELSPLQAQLVQTAIFFGYGIMALPAAFLMRRWGYKAGIVAGLCIFSVGTLLFWPAAAIGQYAPFLIALFLVGCGSATLETAANPFIAQFGAVETSEQRLNFSQSFNAPGSIFGIVIGTYFILSGIENSPEKVSQMKMAGTYAAYVHMEIMRVVPTYTAIGAVILLFALLISLIRFPVIQREHEGSGESHGRFIELFNYPHLWIAVLAEFCYCGAQFSTWSAYIFYMKQYTGVPERTAALLLTGNLAAMALGRFVSTWLMRWFDAARHDCSVRSSIDCTAAGIRYCAAKALPELMAQSSRLASSCRSCFQQSLLWASRAWAQTPSSAARFWSPQCGGGRSASAYHARPEWPSALAVMLSAIWFR